MASLVVPNSILVEGVKLDAPSCRTQTGYACRFSCELTADGGSIPPASTNVTTMTRYCPKCNKFMGEGGQLRLGAAILCKECWAELQVADKMAREVREQSRQTSNEMPEFMKGIFK